METEIKKLIQVVAVARRGNFSRAAEDLHITQPALSRSIGAFEERLGVRIFDRGRNGATITPVGRQIVADAEQLLRSVRAFDHNLQLYSSGHVGNVSFGLGPLISSLVMPDLGQYFLSERPALLLKAVVRPAQQLVQELMDDHIEMLFCAHGQLEPSDALIMEPVGEIEIGMFVRAGHPLLEQQAVAGNDIAQYPMLSGAELSNQAIASGAVVGRAVDSPASRMGGLVLDNYEILQQMCLDTDGIWMSSPQLVGEAGLNGRLRSLAVVDQTRPTRVTVDMARNKERGLTPAAQAVVDFVTGKLAKK